MDSTSTLHDSPVQQQQQPTSSPWHSPLPYMFGGMAAMLGLIAFSLLILACSYYRRGEDGDDESFSKESTHDVEKPSRLLEHKVVVIMAGELMPTYIATPVYDKKVYRATTDKVDVVRKNAGQGSGGGGGYTSDEEEKKDVPHSHMVIDIERGSSGSGNR